MVCTRCVPGCDYEYKLQTDKKYLFFNFLKALKFAENGYEQFPEKNSILDKSHRVCDKHFCPGDFKTLSDRKLKAESQKLIMHHFKASIETKSNSENISKPSPLPIINLFFQSFKKIYFFVSIKC